jgi:hypothetical protein
MAKTVRRQVSRPQIVRRNNRFQISRQGAVSVNPTLMLYSGNGLSAQDALGPVAGTSSPPTRFQPFSGARINFMKNPSLETNNTGWVATGGGTLTRITTDGSQGTSCAEITGSAINAGATPYGPTAATRILAKSIHTLSFDAWWVSGATDWAVDFYEVDAAGSTALSQTQGRVSFTPTSRKQRFTVTYTPTSTGVAYIFPAFRRLTAVAGTIRVDGVVLEQGNVTNPTYFDGSTQGMWLEPLTGIVGSAHASPSVSHAVPWIEEATTNLVTNPSMETNTTGWGVLGSATLTRDTVFALFGNASLKIVTNGVGGGEGFVSPTNSIPATNGQSITYSIWLRGSGTLVLVADLYNSSNVFLQTLTTSPTITLSDTWTRTTFSFNVTNASAAFVQFIARTPTQQASTMYADGIQVEQKGYATSFTDGSLGSGYAWTGTANASTSTRANALLTFDETNHANIASGSILTWFYADSDSTTQDKELIDIGQLVASKDQIRLFRINTTNTIRGYFASNNAQTGIATTTAAAKGQWHLAYVEWDALNIAVSLNGAAKVTSTRTAYVGDLGSAQDLRIGSFGVGTTNIFNGKIGPTLIFNRPLAQSEITGYFNSPSPYGFTRTTTPQLRRTNTQATIRRTHVQPVSILRSTT